jgi:hypothetical protein
MSLTFSKIDFLAAENLKNSVSTLSRTDLSTVSTSKHNSDSLNELNSTNEQSYYKESWLKMKMSVLEKQDEILQLKAHLLDHNSKIADENLKIQILDLKNKIKLTEVELEKALSTLNNLTAENTQLKLLLLEFENTIRENNIVIINRSSDLEKLKITLENNNTQIDTYAIVVEAQEESISELEKKVEIKDFIIATQKAVLSNFEEKFALLLENLDKHSVKETTQEILKKISHLLALQKPQETDNEFKKIIRNWIID